MKSLFGTDGIRGTAGVFPLDERTVTRVGAALARTLMHHAATGPPRIVIGRDTRESGEWIEAALAAGASMNGVTCSAVGVVPTPGIAWMARTGGFAAGVMISASHNPYRDNGIKVFSASGYKLPDEEEIAIERLVLDEGTPPLLPETAAASSRKGVPGAPDHLLDGYAEFLREAVSPGVRFDGMRVVLDCANGASCALAPSVFAALGADVVAIFDTPDGHNINSGCGSLHPDRLAATVKERGADVGIAFDGDADRTLFVSADGQVADGDVLIYQAARYLKKRGQLPGDLVVTTVMSNLWLERSLAEVGIRMARTQVGDKYVLQEMVRSGAVLGGEQSGHIIFADRATTGDGIMTALRLMEVLRANDDTVTGWLSQVRAFPQILLNIPVASRPDLMNHPVIGTTAARVVNELGGDGRLVLRYSGTEPLARVMIEGTDKEQVETLARDLAGVIDQEIGARGE